MYADSLMPTSVLADGREHAASEALREVRHTETIPGSRSSRAALLLLLG